MSTSHPLYATESPTAESPTADLPRADQILRVLHDVCVSIGVEPQDRVIKLFRLLGGKRAAQRYRHTLPDESIVEVRHDRILFRQANGKPPMEGFVELQDRRLVYHTESLKWEYAEYPNATRWVLLEEDEDRRVSGEGSNLTIREGCQTIRLYGSGRLEFLELELLHRDDGPAVVTSDGQFFFFQSGCSVSPEDWARTHQSHSHDLALRLI